MGRILCGQPLGFTMASPVGTSEQAGWETAPDGLENSKGCAGTLTAAPAGTTACGSAPGSDTQTLEECAPNSGCPAAAGAVMSTVGDLHNWYRVLFGAPEQLGLTQGELDGGLSRSGQTAGKGGRSALLLAIAPFRCTTLSPAATKYKCDCRSAEASNHLLLPFYRHPG